ncbi:MAG TPA: 50S ribosomal protein L4 [Patescibacteria group bacterium]|nr:50S ribosomal protein L4 [Patescibacteria group bacterium]
MSQVQVYNQKGEKLKKKNLSSDIFGVKIDPSVIHLVVTALQSNKRQVLAHTKTRSEKRGGGKKPWRQKGTGRARAGSSRSPIWIGGGITFGPRKNRNFKKKVNKKVKRKALFMALTDKVKAKKLILINKFNLSEAKTKIFYSILKNIIDIKSKSKKYKNKKVLLGLPEKDLKIIRAAKNIAGLKIKPISDINVLDVLDTNYLVTTVDGIKKLENQYK